MTILCSILSINNFSSPFGLPVLLPPQCRSYYLDKYLLLIHYNGQYRFQAFLTLTSLNAGQYRRDCFKEKKNNNNNDISTQVDIFTHTPFIWKYMKIQKKMLFIIVLSV